MDVWGGLTNSCEKKRSEKQRRKEKTSHVGEKWHRVLQCSMQQSPQVPGNPSLGNCGCRFHPQVVGKMLRLRRNVVQQEGGAHQADREVDLP